MKMNATSDAANPKNIRKRKRNSVRPPVRAEGPKGGGPNPGGFKGKGNPGGQRSSAPPTGGRGAPNPTPKGEPSAEKRPVPSTPSVADTDKSSENTKKRRLNLHSKCVQASGFRSSCLKRDRGAAPRMRIWFSGSGCKLVTRSTRLS